MASAPVFIHSDKNLRLLARFREAQFVAGYKPTIEPDERLAERERVWQTHRDGTLAAAQFQQRRLPIMRIQSWAKPKRRFFGGSGGGPMSWRMASNAI